MPFSYRMNGVCLYTAKGVGVFCLDESRKWKAISDCKTAKVQLFQNGSMICHPESDQEDVSKYCVFQSIQTHIYNPTRLVNMYIL